MASRGSRAGGTRARAWCRADLAGGTLDIWPLGLLHPGSRTVNVALDLAVEVEMVPTDDGYRVKQEDSTERADSAAELASTSAGGLVGLVALELGLPPVAVTVRSDSPRGAGLGASSALTVGLLAAGEALKGTVDSTVTARAAVARDLEAKLMSLPTGYQDHYPAQMGGVLEVVHQPGGERVNPLAIDTTELSRSLLVVFSGQSHFSAGHNWHIIRRRLDGDPEARRYLDGVRDAAAALVEALERAQLPRVGQLMSEEWGWRRRLADGISTAAIEELLSAAREAGAWGGKACGAGGGGCLAVLCPPERKQEIATGLAALGARVLATNPTAEPMSVGPLLKSSTRV